MDIFETRLKELRLEKNMTQKELAKALETTDDSVFSWEKGRSQPSIEFIRRLTVIFDVSADYLLGRSDDLGNVSAVHSAPTMTDAENEVLRLFRGLTQGRRDDLLIYLRALAGGSGGKTALSKRHK